MPFGKGRRRRRREEGAVAVFVALTLAFVILPLAGLAVDLGMQRIARSDMQTVADLTATDMARALGSGTTPTNAMATASAARDAGVMGAAPTLQVFLGYIAQNPPATFISSQSRGCGGSPYDSYFAPVPAGSTPNAVVVTASNQVSFAFNPGSGGTCRSAVAMVNSRPCFSLGSYAARVNTGDASLLAPLNGIFGLNLSLLSYQNIAGAYVTLAQLAADSHFGTATQLLTGSITVSNLVLATINVLQAQDPTGNAAAITALNSVLTVTAALPPISLPNLLNVSPTDTAAMATRFSVLDLVAGSVLLAERQHAVSIPNLWANVAGTGETSDANLYIQQGASKACGLPGQASASNSQLNGYVNFNQMNSPSINIGVANLKTGIGSGQFTADVAPAQGLLVAPPAPVCGAGTAANPTTFSVQVSSALASAQLALQLPVTGAVSIVGLGLVNLNLTVDVTVATVKPAGGTVVNLSIPPNDTTPVSTGSSVRLDPTTASTTLDASSSANVAGIPVSLSNPLLASTLSSVINGVNGTFVPKTVNPLVGNINTMLTGPVADLLGLEIGGADVYAIPTACDSPALVG